MNTKKTIQGSIDFKNGCVDLSHGAGGRASAQLIEQLFIAAFANPWLEARNDQACLSIPTTPGRLVISTDAHVISPLFFPGGDIGSLSVHGTINDVAMSGAVPLCLAASFILEEGFPLADLRRIVNSMAQAAQDAGVPIVTGDTKVVERGKGDGVFITTTGTGWVDNSLKISGDQAVPGDVVLVSGYLGDHGIAILAQRENMKFSSPMESDTAALHGLVRDMVSVSQNIHVLRDPTRGGLASTLNEIAHQSGVGICLEESAIPIRDKVAAACEFLGLDPLYIANEGKLICICPAAEAEIILQAMRQHPLGKDAAQIGQVQEDAHCYVQMRTQLGGRRMVDWLAAEQLPRIC